MTRYDKIAKHEVEEELHQFKKGSLRIGRSKKPVKSRQQAIAIALSLARKKGAKVPVKRK